MDKRRGFLLLLASFLLAPKTAFAVMDISLYVSNTSTGAISYNIFSSNQQGTSYSVEASTQPSFTTTSGSAYTQQTTTVITTLAPNTTYYSRGKAIDGFGNSSNWSTTVATVTLPTAPTSSSATNIGKSSATLNWGANGNPTGTLYVTQIATTTGFIAIAASSETRNTSALLTNLTPGTTYYARVQTISHSGTRSSLTSLPSFTMNADTGGGDGGGTNPPTAAPFSNVTTSQIQTNWGANGNAAGTSYYVAIATGGFPDMAGGSTSSTTVNTYAIFSGLLANTTYFSTVKLTNVGGTAVNLGSTATLANAPTGGLEATNVGSSSATVKWGANGNPTPTFYFVQISTDLNFNIAANANMTIATQQTFTGLSSSTVYFSRVKAISHGGIETAYTMLDSLATSSSTAAGGGDSGGAKSPTAASYSNVTSSQIQANWGANGNAASTSYRSIISTGTSPDTNNFSGNQSSTTLNTYAVFTSLTPNTTYYGNVNVLNVSTASANLSSTITLANAPASSSATSVGSSSATINWSANGNPSMTRHVAQIAFDSNFSSVYGSSDTRNTYAFFSQLYPGATYFARVKAINHGGTETSYTSLPSFVTISSGTGDTGGQAQSPTAQTYGNVTATQLQANWLANGNAAGTSYLATLSTAAQAGMNHLSTNKSSTTLNTYALFTSLTPNTSYYGDVSVVSGMGAFAELGSTVTLAAQPTVSDFSSVSSTSLQANWGANGNPSDTTYVAILSSAANPSSNGFSGNLSSTTLLTNAVFSGLSAGTTYYVEVKAINRRNVGTTYTNLGSTATTAATQAETPVTPPVVPEITYVTGKVTQSNAQGLTGIVVEAIDPNTNAADKSVTTEANGTGAYSFTGLSSTKKYIIKAIWTANSVTSSVLKDNVPTGTTNLNFNLAVTYSLATLSGTLALPSNVIAALRTSKLQAYQTSASRYSALAQGKTNYEEPFVELAAGNRVVARVPVDETMTYEVKNLLPGSYTVKGFNGKSYTNPQFISVAEGESAKVTLEFPAIEPESAFVFPNPANDESTIRFASFVPSIEASAAIFDVAGNLVKEIPNENFQNTGGVFRARWDTTNSNGERVASGVYLVVITARNKDSGQSREVVKKLAIIR